METIFPLSLLNTSYWLFVVLLKTFDFLLPCTVHFLIIFLFAKNFFVHCFYRVDNLVLSGFI
jgi:hypothetical protein